MKRILTATALLCAVATPSLAQTATGIGVGTSEANSASGAIAVNRGNGNSNSSLTVNNPANVNSTLSGTTTQNINSNVSGSTTSRLVTSGTTTVKNVPSMVAPGLAAAGLETCLGSASGTVSAVGFGIGGGSTYADEGCQARLDSRTLYSYGLKAAAVARLCQRADIWRSMPDMCAQYWPAGVAYPAGIVMAEPAARGVVMSASGTAIRVVDGRDGVEKDCLNYSHTKQKCYQWSGDAPHKITRTAAITPHKAVVGKPVWTSRPAKQPPPEPVPAKIEAPVPESK